MPCVTCWRLSSASASFSCSASLVSGGDFCPSNILNLFGGCLFTRLSSSSVNGTLNAIATRTHTYIYIINMKTDNDQNEFTLCVLILYLPRILFKYQFNILY